MDKSEKENIEIEDDEEDETSSESELDPSRLGTKEYWEEAFTRDLAVFNETKDVGEVWFGNDSMERVINWMSKSKHIHKESSILDIGCGNGVMLIALAKSGYRHLYGVDYVDSAIQLAVAISKQENTNITFKVGNILQDDCSFDGDSSCRGRQFDICHDKGTYDAISLSPSDAKLQRSKYVESVERLCLSGGLYIITSCNWTREELLEHFSQGFMFLEQIPSPTFTFGGITGSRETALVFRRKSKAESVASQSEIRYLI